MRIFILLVLVFCGLVPAARAEEAIVYVLLSDDGYWQVWEMAPDGSQQRQITRSLQDKREPAWVSNGRVIYRTNNGKVFINSRDGSTEEEILAQYERVTNPQMSHDGRQIFFTRLDARAKDIRDIWKTDIQGNNGVILTLDNKRALQPSLSADSRWIAYSRADETRENHHIWVMDSDGKNARQLTDGKGQDLFPRFSPDGQWITFSSNRKDGNFEIYRINIKNKSLDRLTRHEGLDSNSCFSPDGSRIVFVSNRSGNQQLWVMNRDGSNPVQVTTAEGESIEPHWAKLKKGDEK